MNYSLPVLSTDHSCPQLFIHMNLVSSMQRDRKIEPGVRWRALADVVNSQRCVLVLSVD